jgi:hypothetical protein
MKFTLEIELDGIANPAVEVAKLLKMLHNELREDGITPGTHDVNTRSYYRQSADGESTELVANTVGKWEVTESAKTPMSQDTADYVSKKECKSAKTHLQSVDADGYCNGCGEQ